MSNKLLIGLVVLAAGALIGWYWFSGGTPKPTAPAQQETAEEHIQPTGTNREDSMPTSGAIGGQGSEMEKGGVVARSVVTYTDTGFAPTSVSVKRGTTVTFVNESSGAMWVASDVHPTHQLLPGFDQLKSVTNGGTYEYTFTKVGTWRYHNHVKPEAKGTVIVTP